MKLSIKVEPRLETPRMLGIAIPVISLAAALLSGAVFLFFMGVSPFRPTPIIALLWARTVSRLSSKRSLVAAMAYTLPIMEYRSGRRIF